jgi:hypothetical protein
MAEEPREAMENEPADVTADADGNGHALVRPEKTDCETDQVEGNVVDWDVKIDDPPPRPSELISCRFAAEGRRPIIINDDPRD